MHPAVAPEALLVQSSHRMPAALDRFRDSQIGVGGNDIEQAERALNERPDRRWIVEVGVKSE